MAQTPVKTLWLLHGVNLDMLGWRDPAVYGGSPCPSSKPTWRARGATGSRCDSYQTNHEGELVKKIHQIVRDRVDAVIINLGAWTHYSYALRDALDMVTAPIAEVHLSAIEAREGRVATSVMTVLAAVRVSGKGPEGYAEAVAALAKLIAREERQ